MSSFRLVFGDFNLNEAHRVFQSSTGFMDRYLGYHEPRDRWITQEWFWYQARDYRPEQPELDRGEVLRLIAERQAEIQTDVALHQRSKRGVLFEEIADINDDDGVFADFEDGFFDFFE